MTAETRMNQSRPGSPVPAGQSTQKAIRRPATLNRHQGHRQTSLSESRIVEFTTECGLSALFGFKCVEDRLAHVIG